MRKVLVYSCSGCSSAAQMANWIAIQLDRKGIAEMSCIAGIGGSVRPLLNKARDAAFIVGIDGCPLSCVRECLKKESLSCSLYYDLAEHGVKKNLHMDFDLLQAAALRDRIAEDISSKTKTLLTEKQTGDGHQKPSEQGC